MEYYEVTNDDYKKLLKISTKIYIYKLEILDYQESVIDEIIVDIDGSSAGQINMNKQQGTQKSCSITLINPDKKYIPTENNPFWYNRRFKLYIGLTNGADTYWFAQGVYITQSLSFDSHNVYINAVDKFGLLDGTLNVCMNFESLKFEVGTRLGTVIREILLFDIGNGMVLDAVEPIIDISIAEEKLYREYELSANSYYGDFLTEIMTMFGCDIYYDNNGRLIVERVWNDELPYWYSHKGAVWVFSDTEINFQEPSTNVDLDGANYITVATDNTYTENVSYTAKNENPRSPVCIKAVGYKGLQSNAVTTINSGDSSIDSPIRKCKEYAEYMLLKYNCNSIAKTFTSAVIPHLNIGDTILISDSSTDDDREIYLITQITSPFGIGEMTITVANIAWLPTDTESTSLTSDVQEIGRNAFRLSYSLNGGSGTVPTSIVDYAGGCVQLDSGKGLSNGDKKVLSWQDDMYGNKYIIGSHYTIPKQNVVMKAIWGFNQELMTITHVIENNNTTISLYKLVNKGTMYIDWGDNSTEMFNAFDTATNVTHKYTKIGTYIITVNFSDLVNFNYNTNTSKYDFATEIDTTSIKNIESFAAGDVFANSTKLEKVKLSANFMNNPFSNFAFTNCKNLKEVVFPTEDVTTAMKWFYNCRLSSIETGSVLKFPQNITFTNQYPIGVNCGIAETVIINSNFTYQNGVNIGLVDTKHLELNGYIPKLSSNGLGSLSMTLETVKIGANASLNGYRYPFNSFKSLKKIVIESGATTYLIQGIQNCDELEELELGDSIGIEISDCTDSFRSCKKLKMINTPYRIARIYRSFVNLDSLEELTLPSSLTTLVDSVNNLPTLTQIIIPNKTATMTNSIIDCANMKLIVIESSLISGVNFQTCFKKCPSIERYIVNNDNISYTSYNDCLYNKSKTHLMRVPTNLQNIDNFEFAIETTTLSTGCFYECINFSNIILPDTITTIQSGSFNYCTLNSLRFENPNTNINTTALLNTTINIIYGHSGSTAETFANNNNIEFIIIGE